MTYDDLINVAWAAGLFEGEGCISLRKKNSGVTCHLQMTDEDVVIRFQQIMGGRIYGPFIYRDGNKPKWHWYLGKRDECVEFLKKLQPFAGTRRLSRINEALHVVESPNGTLLPHNIILRIAELSRQGLSVSEISRRVGVCRASVRKYSP